MPQTLGFTSQFLQGKKVKLAKGQAPASLNVLVLLYVKSE